MPGDASQGQGDSPGIPGGIFGSGSTTNINLTDTGMNGNSPPSKRNVLQYLWGSLKRLVKRQTSVPTADAANNLVAVGVEYAPDSQSARQTVMATREVIIAAGALHSPQILLLSGIGPVAALQALDIPVNVDLPGVGSNLQE